MRIAPPERSKTQITSTEYKDIGVNTDLTGADLQFLEGELSELKDSIEQLNNECIGLKDKQCFRLRSIGDDKNKVIVLQHFEHQFSCCQQTALLGKH